MPLQSLLNAQIGIKRELLLLIIIVVIASLIRLWDLGATGFNNDEAIYSGQAAVLAGFTEFQDHFSIYRAHPLLLQYIISILFGNLGMSDSIARMAPAILGIITIILVYFIGRALYDRKVAIVAAIVLTILPYHIITSRQVLLDVSMTFFYTLTLFFVVRHLKNPKELLWLYLIGASSGLTFLSKEVGLFALITSIVCLFLIKTISIKNLLIVLSTFILAVSPYWIPVLTIQEANEAFVAYWQWQTNRDPNHPIAFYLNILSLEALGYILTGLSVFAIIYSFKTNPTRKNPTITLILPWIFIPLLLLQFLDVKGYHFVLPVVPFFVLLGVSFLFSDWMKKIPFYRIVAVSFIPLIFIFSGPPIHYLFQIPPTHLVGTLEEPFGREAAIWIRNNIPYNASFLTLETRTANLIKYYSNHDAFSLHANQNPAYTKISNPDIAILNNRIGYLVYEIYLEERASYLKQEARELNKLVIKYDGTPIKIVYQNSADNNDEYIKPAIIIYSLNTVNER